MGFTREIWTAIKTMSPTFKTIFDQISGNVDFLDSALPQAGPAENPVLGRNSNLHDGGSHHILITEWIDASTSGIDLDDTIDWRRRFVVVYGFIRYSSSNSYLPHAANAWTIGRPTEQNTADAQHSYQWYGGRAGLGNELYNAESRVRHSWFTGDGVVSGGTDVRQVDPFYYLSEMPFLRIPSEDTHDPDCPENFNPPPDMHGSFVFLYVDSLNGRLRCKLGNYLKTNTEDPPSPDDDMTIYLSCWASPQMNPRS